MSINQHFLAESNADLVRAIRLEIQQAGAISFHRFMELALYHPEHGYYQTSRAAPGRSGDFLTAPEAHPIFGATLARQVEQFDQLLDRPDPFVIVESGAGRGRLIRPLLAELRQQFPDTYRRIRFHPVESNPTRLDELRQHLADGNHDHLLADQAPEAASGCLLANEFLDALPVRRITRAEGVLHEISVVWKDEWFAEDLLPVHDEQARDYLTRHQFDLEDGDVVEYCPGIASWVKDAAGTLARGFALIIDYGYPAAELFSEHRRAGTLRAYYQHGASEQFFRGVGKQDLTAHVNLGEVEFHAEAKGFTTIGITTQADLLINLGIGERLMRLQQEPGLDADQYLAIRATVMRMIDPGAMGRFRAMMLTRGLDDSEKLLGLSRENA